MKTLAMITATTLVLTGTAMAGNTVSSGAKTQAEQNFSSTHPGTQTGTGGEETTAITTIRPKGETVGVNKDDETVVQTKNFSGTEQVGEVEAELNAKDPLIDTTGEAEKQATNIDDRTVSQ